jgi:hypothetical protein
MPKWNVRPPADELGDGRGQGLDARTRALARRLRARAREVGQRVLPALGQPAREHAVEFRDEAGLGGGVDGVPGGVRGSSALALVEVCGDLLRDVEVLVGIPAVGLLGQAHLFLAQRGAVRLGRVLRVGGADRDVRPHDDQRRPRRLGVGRVERCAQVVRRPAVVQPLHVEPVGLVAEPDVLAEREARGALDRDAVVVVDQAELVQAEEARDRARLTRDALHDVAVGADRVGAVVHQRAAVAVVAHGQHGLRERHADGVSDALPERAGRDLDARDRVLALELGVPGRPGAPLPELLQVVEREVVAGEVQRRVLEDARVAGREHEAVAVGPVRIGRVVSHALAVEDIGDGRERHGGSRVAGVGLLDRVHGEAADGVDRELLDVGGHATPRQLQVAEP